jgi:gliding-associated putative ABC transporter substrate-binding component GldG
MAKRTLSKGFFNWTFFGVFIIGIILINVISTFMYTRFDMTEDNRYSLSSGTERFLEDKGNFKNRLSIKIYMEGNLPSELKYFRNTIEDKLNEFKEIAGNRIEYIFIDPNTGTESDKQAMFENLYAKGKGIIPMDVVYMKDGEQTQMMIWPGAVIDYGGSTVNTIQFLPGTQPGKPYLLDDLTGLIENSVKNLEYMLISSLRRATQESKPRIAFLQGHGELTFAETQRARALISNYYSIADITINDSLAALDDVDGLIIARPRYRFSDKDLYIIDQFVMNGGRLMCLLDPLYLNEDSLNARGVTHTLRYNTGIERMLFDYGLKINDNYVVDAMCAPKSVPFAKQSVIPWFFHVLATPTSHPIARNVEPVSLKYTSEIQFVDNKKLALSPVLTSSTNSNVTGLAPMVSLAMPLNYGPKPELVENPEDESNKRCLAGIAEGYFDSHFKNRIVDEFAKNPLAKYKESSTMEGKVFLIGNGRFIANKYDSMPSRSGNGFMYRPQAINDLRMDPDLAQLRIPLFFGNQEFFQNMVDYMMGDNSVIDIRSRQIDIRKINGEKVKTEAGYYKTMNMLIPILLVLALAFVMAAIRRKRYAQ